MAVTFGEVVGFFSGAISIWILVQQYKIKRAQQEILEQKNTRESEKHQLELHNSRISIYQDLEIFFDNVNMAGKVTSENMSFFYSNIWPGRWKFPKEVDEYLCKVKDISLLNLAQNRSLELVHGVEERNPVAQEAINLLKELGTLHTNRATIFEPFIRVGQ